MEQPRVTAISRATNRPVLYKGADRRLMIILVFVCMGECFALKTLWIFPLMAVVFSVGCWALVRMAKADPLMYPVWERHRKYKALYLAKSSMLSRSTARPVRWPTR